MCRTLSILESWASCSMPSITGGLNGAPAGRFLDVSGWVGVLSVESGGLEPCRCSRPARDAAPTIAPTIFWSDRLAADAGGNFHEQGPLPSKRPISWGSARKPARTTGRVAVAGVGVVSCAFRLKESLPCAGLMAVTREEPLSVDARSPRPAASSRPSVCTPRPDTSTRATKG